MTKVELYCKAERVVIAEIETGGQLDEVVFQAGLNVLDHRCMPPAELWRDGVQLTCARCHEPLWFRSQDQELFVAVVGSVRALP